MKTYSGNYLGIVIQSNDPEMRGRVKVFVPHISTSILSNWNDLPEDKLFSFTDNEQLQKILPDLKQILPWAEYAGPIFGGSATGIYNATEGKGTAGAHLDFDKTPTEGMYRPANLYANELRQADAFSATGKVANLFVNPHANNYSPTNYSTMARGMFSIPNVGAHVWVWFINGDPNYPVYFAAAYGEEDVKRIYTTSLKHGLNGEDATSQDYPGKYENVDMGEHDSDTQTLRNKHVLNTNKHTLEFVDTDGLEKVKLNHYSGSMLEMSNDVTTQLSVKDDQKLVMGDSFKTIQKNSSEYIGGSRDLIIQSDSFEKIGKQNHNLVNDIYEIYKKTHVYKRLFNVKRTKYQPNNPVFESNVVSTSQDMAGSFGICPICEGLPYLQNLTDGWKMSPEYIRMPVGVSPFILPINMPIQHLGFFVPGIPPLLQINGQRGYYMGRHCAVCNLPISAYTYHELNGIAGSHIGLSPSTANGFWEVEPLKASYGSIGAAALMKESNVALMELQSKLGPGGDVIRSISRNHVVNVGLAMNMLESYRVDSRGKLKVSSNFVAPEGVYESFTATPHVEKVDVDALPGGDYIVTAGNRMSFTVGANGINIKTFGPIEMYGTISNITAEQMNLISTHELYVDGGEKLTLRARHISINPFEHGQLMVDGGLSVTRNSIFAGAVHVEGELGIQHITAPREWHITEGGGGLMMKLAVFNCKKQDDSIPDQYALLMMPDHQHRFESIPMTLGRCKEEARDMMITKQINTSQRVAADEVKSINGLDIEDVGAMTSISYLDTLGVENPVVEVLETITEEALAIIPELSEVVEDSISDGITERYEQVEAFVAAQLNSASESGAFGNGITVTIAGTTIGQ